MEESKVVEGMKKLLFGFIRPLTSKYFLAFLDVMSIFACFWTVLWLIYFTFVRDFIEVLLYACSIYVNRIMWLCRIFRVKKLLVRIDTFIEDDTRSNPQDVYYSSQNVSSKNSQSNSKLSNSLIAEQLLSNKSDGTPRSVKNKLMITPRVLDFNSEQSTDVMRCDDAVKIRGDNLISEGIILIKPDMSKHEKEYDSRFKEMVISSPKRKENHNTEKDLIESPPKTLKLSPKETLRLPRDENVILNHQQNFGSPKVEDTNLKQNLILSPEYNYDQEVVFTSPKKTFDFKEFFSFNFIKIKSSLQKEDEIPSVHSLRRKCETIAGKVVQVQPTKEDDEDRLILSSDSPLNVGCCNNLIMCFKPKLQMAEVVPPASMHYKRF